MSLPYEIEKLLREAVTDGTFTREALSSFKEALDSVDTLKEENAKLGKRCDAALKERDSLRGKLESAAEELKEYRSIEDIYMASAHQAELNNLALAYEQSRVEDHKAMVGLVFRNTMVREAGFQTNTVPVLDQYGTIQYPSATDSLNKTIDEE